MERIILTADYVITDDGDYVDAILEQVFDGPAAAIAEENDHRGEVRCEISVRRFVDPKIQRVRWALMICSDEFELRDYPSKREALGAYRTLIRQCAAEGIIWATNTVFPPPAR